MLTFFLVKFYFFLKLHFEPLDKIDAKGKESKLKKPNCSKSLDLSHSFLQDCECLDPKA